MTTFLSLLPLLFMFVLYALFIKLAAKTYRRSVLTWKHAFAFGALAIVVGGVGAFINRATNMVLGPALGIVLGFSIQLAIGGWYLGPRTKTSSGESVMFKGGALIAAIAFGFIVLLGIVAAILVPLFNPSGQA